MSRLQLQLAWYGCFTIAVLFFGAAMIGMIVAPNNRRFAWCLFCLCSLISVLGVLALFHDLAVYPNAH